jgi:hypothetical protein
VSVAVSSLSQEFVVIFPHGSVFFAVVVSDALAPCQYGLRRLFFVCRCHGLYGVYFRVLIVLPQVLSVACRSVCI